MSTSHFILNSSPRWPASGAAGNPRPFAPAGLGDAVERMRQAQRKMWPAVRPRVPGLDYDSAWRAAGATHAGFAVDYLDFFELDGGNFALAIGDLTGETSFAAVNPLGTLLLSSLHTMVRSLGAQSTASLGELMHSIHELFYEASPDGGYATVFLARYDPIERRLDYCNAGHEAPVLLRKAGARRRTILLENGGPMVGLLRRSNFHQRSIRLQPGDILAAYTSGLTEVLNRRGEEWGYRRMVASIEEAADRPARDMVEYVLEEARGFSSGAASTRDMTLWLGRLDDAMAASPRLEAAAVEIPETAVLAA